MTDELNTRTCESVEMTERMEAQVQERMEAIRQGILAHQTALIEDGYPKGKMQGLAWLIRPGDGMLFEDDPRTRIKLGG